MLLLSCELQRVESPDYVLQVLQRFKKNNDLRPRCEPKHIHEAAGSVIQPLEGKPGLLNTW